jgi:hypothetical protein
MVCPYTTIGSSKMGGLSMRNSTNCLTVSGALSAFQSCKGHKRKKGEVAFALPFRAKGRRYLCCGFA